MFTIPKQPQSAASNACWPRATSCEHHQSLHTALTRRNCSTNYGVLGSPSRESKESKSGTDAQPNPLRDGEIRGCSKTRKRAKVERTFSLPGIFLGTSAFTADGWQGSFYPPGMKSRDFLSYYATQFATVEVDSTFYGCPSARTVNNWAARTPEDFIFSVKIPQVITHEKVLVDCDSEFAAGSLRTEPSASQRSTECSLRGGIHVGTEAQPSRGEPCRGQHTEIFWST
jgi:hypothetical protein